MYGQNVNLHWKSSKFSLALQPEALVNTSGRVDFSSPDDRAMAIRVIALNRDVSSMSHCIEIISHSFSIFVIC